MIQRVSEATVTVDGSVVGEIGRGLVVLVGVASGDGEADVVTVVRKVSGMRLFPDDDGRMNRSILEIGGAILVVSQFTLLADVHRGRRPSYTRSADASAAEPLVEGVCSGFSELGLEVSQGMFGARMRLSLVNDGPVTIVMDVVGGQVVR